MSDRNEEAAHRVGIADTIVISNPREAAAHRHFDYLRLRARQRSDRGTTGVLLVGPTQTGKSTILHAYRRRLNTPEALEEGRIPVLMVTLTANQTRKGLSHDILRAIDAYGYETFWEKGTENQLLGRVPKYLQHRQVELLILDEFQHLVHSEDQKLAASVSDTVKWLLMESVVPIVMSGVEEAWRPLHANAQLAQRCPAPIVLNPLSSTNAEDEELFCSFLISYLSEIEERQLLKDALGVLSQDKVPESIFEVTGGVLGQACNLVKDALYRAVLRGSETLTVGDLSSAAESVWGAMDRSFVNPFVHGLAPVRRVRRTG